MLAYAAAVDGAEAIDGARALDGERTEDGARTEGGAKAANGERALGIARAYLGLPASHLRIFVLHVDELENEVEGARQEEGEEQREASQVSVALGAAGWLVNV